MRETDHHKTKRLYVAGREPTSSVATGSKKQHMKEIEQVRYLPLCLGQRGSTDGVVCCSSWIRRLISPSTRRLMEVRLRTSFALGNSIALIRDSVCESVCLRWVGGRFEEEESKGGGTSSS